MCYVGIQIKRAMIERKGVARMRRQAGGTHALEIALMHLWTGWLNCRWGRYHQPNELIAIAGSARDLKMAEVCFGSESNFICRRRDSNWFEASSLGVAISRRLIDFLDSSRGQSLRALILLQATTGMAGDWLKIPNRYLTIHPANHSSNKIRHFGFRMNQIEIKSNKWTMLLLKYSSSLHKSLGWLDVGFFSKHFLVEKN